MNTKKIHLIMFMGQSNMAGRGNALEAPAVPLGTAYEFRAITAPNTVYPLKEPFGKDENNLIGVNEPGMKTGSLVSAFVNSYFDITHTPVVGVSCSKGGSSIAQWIPGTAYYEDAVNRFQLCENWLQTHNIEIEHRLMVWCQGCTDGDLHTDPDVYLQNTAWMIQTFQEECHIETCFLIQIGNHRDHPDLYLPIQNAQIRLTDLYPDIVLVSTQFSTFATRGLMKDQFHYYQEGYNIVGTEAGKNAGEYIMQR